MPTSRGIGFRFPRPPFGFAGAEAPANKRSEGRTSTPCSATARHRSASSRSDVTTPMRSDARRTRSTMASSAVGRRVYATLSQAGRTTPSPPAASHDRVRRRTQHALSRGAQTPLERVALLGDREPARRRIAFRHVVAVHEIPHGRPSSKSSSCTHNLRLSINPIGHGATHKLHGSSTGSNGFVHENARA